MSVLCGEGRCSSLFYVLFVVDYFEIGTKNGVNLSDSGKYKFGKLEVFSLLVINRFDPYLVDVYIYIIMYCVLYIYSFGNQTWQWPTPH